MNDEHCDPTVPEHGPPAPDPADPSTGPTPFGAAAEQLRVAGDPEMGRAGERVRLAAVTHEPVVTTELADAVADPRCGAVVTFDGVVRDHDGGRGVERLEYTAHPGAGEVIVEVAGRIAARYPDSIVAVAHRCGPLQIGEAALACAVSAPHRKQAFAACDELVDTVKQRLPIWKHQVFDDGESEWVGALG